MDIKFVYTVVEESDKLISNVIKEENVSNIRWQPILKPWCEIIVGAGSTDWDELKVQFGEQFKSRVEHLLRKWKKYLYDLSGEVNTLTNESDFSDIEDKVDNNEQMTKQDILVIIYFGISRLIEKFETDDEDPFYFLFTLTDSINENSYEIKEKNLHSDRESRNGFLATNQVNKFQIPITVFENEESPSQSRYAWLALLAENRVEKRTYTTIIKKYCVPVNRTYDSFRKEYNKAREFRKLLASENRVALERLNPKTKGTIRSCLLFAQAYFENSKDEKVYKLATEFLAILED